MNINIYKLQNKHITPHLLCALTWMNVLLLGILMLQQQQESNQAYLLNRTPGSVQHMQKTVLAKKKVARHRLVRTIAEDSFAPIVDTPVEDSHVTVTPIGSSSKPSLTTLSASSSVRSVTPVPFLAAPETSASSSRMYAETLHNAASASASAVAMGSFPAFDHASMPVGKIPNWGAMKTPEEWNRSYSQMAPADFVPIPFYDLITLTIPVKSLEKTRDDPKTIDLLTEKLFYSTRYFGAYDIDADEFTAIHPGIDMKLPDGAPVGAVAGGRVHEVRRDDNSLGLHVIIEHHAPDGKVYYSIYGHLASTSLKNGDTVKPGQTVGLVGMTGNTSGPHLHLQIDRGDADETYHTVYWPTSVPSRQEADKHAINPIRFMQQYR